MCIIGTTDGRIISSWCMNSRPCSPEPLRFAQGNSAKGLSRAQQILSEAKDDRAGPGCPLAVFCSKECERVSLKRLRQRD